MASRDDLRLDLGRVARDLGGPARPSVASLPGTRIGRGRVASFVAAGLAIIGGLFTFLYLGTNPGGPRDLARVEVNAAAPASPTLARFAERQRESESR